MPQPAKHEVPSSSRRWAWLVAWTAALAAHGLAAAALTAVETHPELPSPTIDAIAIELPAVESGTVPPAQLAAEAQTTTDDPVAEESERPPSVEPDIQKPAPAEEELADTQPAPVSDDREALESMAPDPTAPDVATAPTLPPAMPDAVTEDPSALASSEEPARDQSPEGASFDVAIAAPVPDTQETPKIEKPKPKKSEEVKQPPKKKPAEPRKEKVVKKPVDPDPAPQPKAKKQASAKKAKSTEDVKGGQSAGSVKKGAGGTSKASAGSIGAYAAQVRARILARKPSGGGARGTTVIRFSLSTSGALRSASVARSSGNKSLDGRALATVRSTSFPTPPAGTPAGQLTFDVPFQFQ